MDFLVHAGGRFELYEAKWTEQPGVSDSRFLKLVAAELPKRSVTRQGVVCRAANRYPIVDDVQALPLAEL